MQRIVRLAGWCVLVLSTAGHAQEQSDDARPPLWQVIERALEVGGTTESAQIVLDHLAAVPTVRSAVVNRPSCVIEGLREPWRVPDRAAKLRELLAGPARTPKQPDFAGLVPGIAGWLDRDDYAIPSPTVDDPGLEELHRAWEELQREELEGLALLESLSAYVGTAHLVLAECLDGMEDGPRALLFEDHVAFCESWYRTHMPENRADEQATPAQQAVIGRFTNEIFARDAFDRARALGAATALLRLSAPEFRDGLARRLKRTERGPTPTPPGFDGDVRAVVGDSPANRVVLGGPRKTEYAGPAALIIDLGGNDVYTRAAVVDDPDALVSIVLDLRGGDLYETVHPGPAYAVAGVAILCDVGGDDEYVSARLGQGASAFGFALLADLRGDDTYRMQDYGQGHSLCGVGLLYDLEGDDTYEAWAVAQGGGIGYGFSALVDGAGNDRYLADLHWPDVYGNSGPDCYHGASQGYCTGLRGGGLLPRIAGGIAALVDLGDGKDRYQSGNFSQGGAYYFSFALMYDDGGDDENFGSRYSQGFGVHQGVAVRWDAGGDDQYTHRSVAHTGMAWDEGVGYFLDDEGDDVYRVGGLSLGGAAQTGIAICVDGGGKDVYEGKTQTQGDVGGSEYHQKPSLGVLIDLGGGKDTYSAPDRADDSRRVVDGVGVFLDTRAKTLEKALTAKELRD